MTVGDAMQLDASLSIGEVAGEGGSGRGPGAVTRAVEVAVDAAGRGGDRTYTYLVPSSLADLELGEAVLVEFGRRQALGIVVAEASEPPSVAVKPIVDRVRADGPLLPALTLALARWIADHYLAPPALVLRAMLPPGLLERLELVAELAPDLGERGASTEPREIGPAEGTDPADADLLTQLERGPRPVRDLAGPDGRAGLLRRLRGMAADGRISLEWTLVGAGAGPRFERWIRLRDEGRAVVMRLTAGDRIPGRPLGPRQLDVLRDLAAARAGELPAADLAGRHGQASLAGLVRRGLAEAEVRERPRRPLAARPA